MFTIGVFSELTGVSAKRLRHYDAIDLFHPAWTDPASSYRYYLASQIPELQRIVALRDLGIPLAEIAASTGEQEAFRSLLERRRAEVLQERARIERKLAELEIRIDESDDTDVVIRRRSRGQWASLRRVIGPGEDLGPLFVEAERVVTAARARAPRPPVAVDHGPEPGGRSVEILIPLARRIPGDGEVRVTSTPPALIATAITTGGYPTLAHASAWGRRWASKTGHAIVGPTWLSYLRFAAEGDLGLPEGFQAEAGDEYLTEIQVPIQPAILPR